MTDKIDILSPEMIETHCRNMHDAVTSKLIPAYYGVQWQSVMRALSARVVELEAECWRMQEERDRAIGWRDSDKARAAIAELKE